MTPVVRLSWDRGTILVRCEDEALVEGLPGVLWDARVRCHRASAYKRTALTEAIRQRGARLDDQLAPPLPSPARWEAPELRPYQAGALAAWEAAGRRGLVVLPTGSGKTRLALAAIANAACRALCLVPTRVLMEQWVDVVSASYPAAVGRFGDGARLERPITVATFASARLNGERLGCRFDLLVVDEVHHFGGGTNDEALEFSAAPHRLGLTATPPLEAERLEVLEALIGPVVYRANIDDLAGRYLAPYQVVTRHLPLDRGERLAYTRARADFEPVFRVFARSSPGARWTEFLAVARASEEGRKALRGWQEARRVVAHTKAKRLELQALLHLHRAARVLVFTPDNETAYAVAREHLVMPLTCHVGRKERAEALGAFESGRLGVLVSAQVLNEGLDVPTADVAIVVGGARGDREYLQRIGRVLRPSPGKQATIHVLVSVGTFEESQALRRMRSHAAR